METFKPTTLTTLALSGATLCFAFAAIPPITGIGFVEKASAATPTTKPKPPVTKPKPPATPPNGGKPETPTEKPKPPKPKPSDPCYGPDDDKDKKCRIGWFGPGSNNGQVIGDPNLLKALPKGTLVWRCDDNVTAFPQKMTGISIFGTKEPGGPEIVPCTAPTAVNRLNHNAGKGEWIEVAADKQADALKNIQTPCGTYPKYVPVKDGEPCFYRRE